eukprot:GHVR01007917.1.p1 GENE.GHVR01007917.1~~GHVR01007917.1.p1  ORF type:complete len:265 (-),score=76.11 GHVR01007917.1:698-1492(-)
MSHDFDTPQVCLEDVGGLNEAKQSMYDLLQLPLQCSVVFDNLPIKLRRGALLIGPSGCGKSKLVQGSVCASGHRLITVKGPQLLSKFVGMSEAAVRQIFNTARSAGHCVIFFDELEALAPRRGADSTGVTDRVVNQLLCYLDGMGDIGDVVCVAASSRPDMLDPALVRPGRFDKVIYCGVPTFEEKKQILDACIKKLPMDSSEGIEGVVEAFPLNFSGADIQAVCNEAHLRAIHEYLDRLKANTHTHTHTHTHRCTRRNIRNTH